MIARSFSKIAIVACAAIICIGIVGCSRAVSRPAEAAGQQPSQPPPGEPPAGAQLRLSATTSDSRPSAGTQFTLSATVTNDGAETLPAVTLRFFRSTDATITTADTEVGTRAVAALGAAASASDSVVLTAPATPGTYYYGACMESDCSAAVQVDVPPAVPQMQAQPDLVVAGPLVSDSDPAAGTQFTLSATVRNDGDAAAAATTLRFYRSTDATITTADTEVGSGAVAQLAAAATASDSASLTAPASAGTYYYGACVDPVIVESDTTNNCSAAVQVNVPAAVPAVPQMQALPDLVVAELSVNDSDPAPGTQFTLSVTVRNDGDAAAAATTLRYFRSTDATITTADTDVGTGAVAQLAASASASDSASLTAPASAGTYYYGACVDPVTAESDTTNNCSEAVQVNVPAAVPAVPPMQAQPDLVVADPSVSDSGPAAGTQFTLSATVRNDGDAAAAATTLRYFRSTDATITTADTEVGTGAVAQLAASASARDSVSLTAPASAGTYYYGACVNPVTDESDTTNNCSAAVPVDVPAAVPPMQAQPDLVVVEPSVSDRAPTPGATFTLSATVRNDGAGASAATTLRYYQSPDAMITTSDTEVETAEVAALAASGSSRKSVDVTAPATAGTYYYGACVDAVTDESDATNNCSSSLEETVQDPEGLPLVRIYSESGAVTEGMSARFRVTVTPPPTADLEVSLSYVEIATTEEYIILYYPIKETTVTVSESSPSPSLTVGTIDDDSDADGDGWVHAWVNHGIGYTPDGVWALAVVAVVDDDVPADFSVLTITPVSASVSEGTAVEFTVYLVVGQPDRDACYSGSRVITFTLGGDESEILRDPPQRGRTGRIDQLGRDRTGGRLPAAECADPAVGRPGGTRTWTTRH